jgi:hypothetical protein
MICSERSTRVLPGLSQALSWLRESLPPTERAPVLSLALVTTTARPTRRRLTVVGDGPHSLPRRHRPV